MYVVLANRTDRIWNTSLCFLKRAIPTWRRPYLGCVDGDVESSADCASGTLPSVRGTGRDSDRLLTEVAATAPHFALVTLRSGQPHTSSKRIKNDFPQNAVNELCLYNTLVHFF